MSRKLLSILVLLLLIFGIYNFRQGILDNYVSIYAQDEKDEDKPKKEIDYSKYCWNLYALYKNDDAWKRDLKKFNEDMNELENYIGKITKSKTHLSFGLAIKEKLDIKLNDLSAYAKLNKDLNKNSYEYLSMTEEISKSYSKYIKIISQLELEILKLPDKECNKYLSDKKINSKYGMYIRNIRRNKKHYLDDKSENILSNLSSINGLPSNVYDLFRNMDKKTEITPSEYETVMQNYDREKRILSGQYEKYRDKLWINNYITALEQAGASKETIKDFKKLLKGYSVDTLSNMLPTINIYYPQTDEYGQKQVNEAIDNLQKDMLILRGVIKIKDDNTITLYKDPDKNNNNNK